MQVVFFVGSCEADISSFPGDIRCLATPDTYPPQRKVFLLWAYLAKHFSEHYTWFMKVDHDTYVNARVMQDLIGMLMTPRYSDKPGYYGAQAKGRLEERGRLGLNGKAYCSGLGYVVNKPILLTLAEWGMDSLAKVVSNHSDTEVGRCVHFHSRVECEPPGDFKFHQVYYQQDGRHVFPMKLIHGGQMNLVCSLQPVATFVFQNFWPPHSERQELAPFHDRLPRVCGLIAPFTLCTWLADVPERAQGITLWSGHFASSEATRGLPLVSQAGASIDGNCLPCLHPCRPRSLLPLLLRVLY